MPKLSAVLPNHNNVAFLARTLDSLVNQVFRGLEIIVIDDCSDDGSVVLINHYVRKYKNVRVVALEDRKGAAYCRNLGNSLAQSNLIMVCDSGDINHKFRARDAYYFLKKRKDVDVYSTSCVETDMLDEQVEAHIPRIFKKREKPSLFHPTVVYRKHVADKIKYREGNLATDQYETFFFEAHNAGFKFWFTFEAMVKKLIQNKDEFAIKSRLGQRKKNYKEFGVEGW